LLEYHHVVFWPHII